MNSNHQVVIRKATSGDEFAIAKVHIQSWQEAYHGIIPQEYLDALPSELEERIRMWTNILANPQRWAWVAVNSYGVVGFVLFGPPRDPNREGFIELGAIYLLASEKGNGTGFSLLCAGFDMMKSLGYKKAYCWVLENNPTIKFYERSGANFSGQTKVDDIGGHPFKELAYDWNTLDKRPTQNQKIHDWSDFKLLSPASTLKESFLRAFDSIIENSEKLAWLYLGDNADLSIPKENFYTYVEMLRRRETDAPNGFVCDTTFWAVHQSEVIGRISLRHELNDFLKKFGGHIGYIVHPAWRNKGVAGWMLSEILKTDRAKSIKKLLLTCDEDNIASQKTILKNKGVLSKTVEVGPDRPRKQHYWINI